jgi:hypothetical protein
LVSIICRHSSSRPSRKSELFRKLWAQSAGTKRFNHPLLGPLELGYENLTVNGTSGQTLTVYHAFPGTTSEQAITLLSSMPAAHPSSRPNAGAGAGLLYICTS